jgi:hypothetical protein
MYSSNRLVTNTNGFEQVSRKRKTTGSLLNMCMSTLIVSCSSSFKLDRRKMSTTTSAINGRVTKRKPRAALSKCLVRIRGVQFHTHPNGKCLQRLGRISLHISSMNRLVSITYCFIIRFRQCQSVANQESGKSD